MSFLRTGVLNTNQTKHVYPFIRSAIQLVTLCEWVVKGKGKGKGICLESRYPRYTCSSDFTFPLAVGAYGSLQLSIQPWICARGTHYGWVDRGSVEYEVCPTLLHMASTGNRTPDLLIFWSNALSTWPRAPKSRTNKLRLGFHKHCLTP